jgi:hypothetical protein
MTARSAQHPRDSLHSRVEYELARWVLLIVMLIDRLGFWTMVGGR